MKRLLIVANSPGELAGWARPIAEAWTSQSLGPVDVLLLPCSFATGQEQRVAQSLPGVERVYRPNEFWRLLWSDGEIYREGVLLHLGGDLMYSAFLSWRWKLKAWSYLWARPWWNSAFTGFLTKNEWGIDWLKKRKVPDEKIHLVGDLVLDSVRSHVEPPFGERKEQISYLPGSRRIEVSVLAPFLLELQRRLRESHPELEGVLHVSPFLPESELKSILEAEPDPDVGGVRGYYKDGYLQGPHSRLKIATGRSYNLLSQSRLAVSIPGTKTAEAGYLRTPVYTIVPLNKPEHLPSHGLLGLLDFLPGGAKLKGQLLLRMKDKAGFLAHPNILAQSYLLPEFVEVISAEVLAGEIRKCLDSPQQLQAVSQKLAELYPWTKKPALSTVKLIRE